MARVAIVLALVVLGLVAVECGFVNRKAIRRLQKAEDARVSAAFRAIADSAMSNATLRSRSLPKNFEKILARDPQFSKCFESEKDCCNVRLHYNFPDNGLKSMIAPQQFTSWVCVSKTGKSCQKSREPLEIVFVTKDKEISQLDVPNVMEFCEQN